MSDNHEGEPVIDPSGLFYSTEESEPPEPTDETKDESPSEDEVIEDSEEDTDKVDDAETDDTETDAEESDKEDEGDDEGAEDKDTLYVELDGEEISLDDIRDMKKSHDAGKSMQADYTKKTMLLADDRKVFEADRDAFKSVKAKVEGWSLELEAMVAEDEAVDWKELKEDDPEQYIELKEKADKRKAKVAELKSVLPKSNVKSDDDIAVEQQRLLTLFPKWMEDGKPTDQYEVDVKKAFEYAQGIGYTMEELNNLCDAHHWKALVDASRGGKKTDDKKAALKKKVKKAPLVTKPKKTQAKKPVNDEDLFYKTVSN